MTICPKCNHVRKEHDAGHPAVCPACGIAYGKWEEARNAALLEEEEVRRAGEALAALEAAANRTRASETLEAFDVPVVSFWQRVHHYTCFMPSDGHIAAFWAHISIYVLFFIWGLRFIAHGIDWLWIGESFLHNVNLPFHEYGHRAFSPFGAFWTALGGSLFQIVLPLFPLVWFMVWQRDNFAASIMLWWCGQNFIDVAPYIADAQLRLLPLIGGDENSHDWWNILRMAGKLDFADYYANWSFTIGACVILLSNAWGAYLLAIEFLGRARPGPFPAQRP